MKILCCIAPGAFFIAFGAVFLTPLPARAGTTAADTVQTVVTYVSSGSVYLGAGSARGIAPGDSVAIQAGSASPWTKGLVSAVSSRSSAVQIGQQGTNITPGAQVIVFCREPRSAGASGKPGPSPASMSAVPAKNQERGAGTVQASRAMPERAPVRGRVAVQYAGAAMEGSPTPWSETSLVTQLQAPQLFGTDITLTLFGRASYEGAASPYAPGSRFHLRLYEASLSYEPEQSAYGWSAGRVFSRFVGGLGQVDGLQLFVRRGVMTVGAIGGLQPDWRSSGVTSKDQKAALFVNAVVGSWESTRWDVTGAYARQLHKGKLDRDFLYVQNSLRLFQNTFLSQITEIDLHAVTAGEVKPAFRVANSSISISSAPLRWVSASAGYDAARPLYLFESMRWIPDTLLDLSIRRGYRGSLMFRLPASITLSTWGRYAPPLTNERAARAAGAGIRITDLFHSGFSIGVQGSRNQTLYTDGGLLALDAEQWISAAVMLQARAERYVYDARYDPERHAAVTISSTLSVQLPGRWYLLASGELLRDQGRTVRHLFGELGLQL